jgi:hypothetical protein
LALATAAKAAILAGNATSLALQHALQAAAFAFLFLELLYSLFFFHTLIRSTT